MGQMIIDLRVPQVFFCPRTPLPMHCLDQEVIGMNERTGLTISQVKEREKIYGRNEISVHKKNRIKKQLKNILSEPIYLLLSVSAVIYFILGDGADGIIMIFFVIFVIGIDLFQDIRTGNALKKLKNVTQPKVEVIREGINQFIAKEELVPGDLVLLQEGDKIPADGHLIASTGLSVDESILTGESAAVSKEAIEGSMDLHFHGRENRGNCFSGTMVVLGSGKMIVDRIGNSTEYGKIAENLAQLDNENSLLQRQLKKLAKQCLYFAIVLFILVSFVTFFNLSSYSMSERIIHSALAGIVLALSMVPGEFPVILSVFFSMGALRLVKKKALVRRLSSVETLGAVSVLCMDKTGTITENRMQVSDAFIAEREEGRFCKILALASRKDTCDSVEKACLDYGEQLCSHCSIKQNIELQLGRKVNNKAEVIACSMEEQGILLREYPFTNEMKAMGRLWLAEGKRVIVAKGSPEGIMQLCNLKKTQEKELLNKLSKYSKQGYKVIALADTVLGEEENLPEKLADCKLSFRGMLALSDPPRSGIAGALKTCYQAGMRIVMITGDHPMTAASIAEKVGIKNPDLVITGEEIEAASDEQLYNLVKNCNIFARVMPQHKMRIVKAIKQNGDVVAMTGDGVNDSIALKMADIGIAMGERGSEVSREAADLILLDDNVTTILETIRDGRRIYQNIQKTIAYVLAFHIPIALCCLIAPLLGTRPQELLLMPLHIVLLELVMDPTVSVALERQPAEPDIMRRPPRNPAHNLMDCRGYIKSLLQGIIIFFASFFLYYGMLKKGFPVDLSRSCGFTVLVLSSILLVLVNCSQREFIIHTIYRLRSEKSIWILNLMILAGLGFMIYSPLNHRLGFAPLAPANLLLTILVSLLSVLWYEIVKIGVRVAERRKKTNID